MPHADAPRHPVALLGKQLHLRRRAEDEHVAIFVADVAFPSTIVAEPQQAATGRRPKRFARLGVEAMQHAAEIGDEQQIVLDPRRPEVRCMISSKSILPLPFK